MKNDHKKNYKIGYTLIETLIYATLFVLLLGAIVNSIMLLSNSYRNLKAVRDVESSAVTAMNRMTREIKGASSVDGTGTSYNTSSGSLLLNTTDSSNQATTIKFYLSNGAIMMDKGGSYFGPLTGSTVNVTSLIFRPINASSSQAVKIEMNIQSNDQRNIINKNFYNTAILRGSY